MHSFSYDTLDARLLLSSTLLYKYPAPRPVHHSSPEPVDEPVRFGGPDNWVILFVLFHFGPTGGKVHLFGRNEAPWTFLDVDIVQLVAEVKEEECYLIRSDILTISEGARRDGGTNLPGRVM